MKNLYSKFKIYGPAKFIKYSISEITRKIWLEPIRHSYSQNGEDLLIHKILKNKKRGFYIDIGSNDPIRFNNTKYFSILGWTGINVEPNAACFKKIEEDRKKDINLNFGVGDTLSKLTFYEFVPDTLSTFSKRDALKYRKMGYILKSQKQIAVKPLSSILKKYRGAKQIDLMSIDTEGYDEKVLLSNNWSKYRPRVICVESVEHTIKGSGKDTGLKKIFTKFGYEKYFDNGVNCIYVDKKGTQLE